MNPRVGKQNQAILSNLNKRVTNIQKKVDDSQMNTQKEEVSTILPSEDITKVYEEIGQLRSQQFFLGTVALTASGLAALFIDQIAATASANIWFLLSSTSIILGLLVWLFYWSMSLKQFIMINSEILKLTKSTQWEHYRQKVDTHWHEKIKEDNSKEPSFFRKFFSYTREAFRSIYTGEVFVGGPIPVRSQTNLIHQAFRIYGLIIFFGSVFSFFISDVGKKLRSWEGPLLVVLLVVVFLIYIASTVRIRNIFERSNEKIRNDMEDILFNRNIRG